MRRAVLNRTIFSLLALAAALSADSPREHILFVEPPLRFLTQCEFERVEKDQLYCQRNEWSRPVRLSPNVKVWRGADSPGTAALRRGDMLDIRLGVDNQGREVAEFVWANLVKVEGVLGRIGRGWVEVYPLIPATIGETERSPVFVWFTAGTDFLAASGSRGLRRGQPIVIIGLRVGNNRVQASRVLATTDSAGVAAALAARP